MPSTSTPFRHPSGDETDPGRETERLIAMAGRNDSAAWTELVRRYSPLVRAVARQHRLGSSSVHDVEQNVWIRCLEHLNDLRDPAALPGWLRTTTHREAMRLTAAERRVIPTDPVVLGRIVESNTGPDASARILRCEADQAVREGLAELPDAQRELLGRMYARAGVGYRELSLTMGIPTGSIGPTRARTLAKLRRTTALRRYLGSSTDRDTA